MKDKGVVKISMNLPTELFAKLKAVAKSEGRTATDVFRRALEMDLFLSEQKSKGSKIMLEKPNGETAQVFNFRTRR